MSNKELIEYFWDEQQEFTHLTYENTYTGVIVTEGHPAPLNPESWLKGLDLRTKYFAELKTWLKTQDPYGRQDGHNEG